MNCLLIGGAPSVGKSETIFRIAKRLKNIGFVEIENKIPDSKKQDFRVILEGKDIK